MLNQLLDVYPSVTRHSFIRLLVDCSVALEQWPNIDYDKVADTSTLPRLVIYVDDLHMLCMLPDIVNWNFLLNFVMQRRHSNPREE